jgi:hypothetical protein
MKNHGVKISTRARRECLRSIIDRHFIDRKLIDISGEYEENLINFNRQIYSSGIKEIIRGQTILSWDKRICPGTKGFMTG